MDNLISFSLSEFFYGCNDGCDITALEDAYKNCCTITNEREILKEEILKKINGEIKSKKLLPK